MLNTLKRASLAMLSMMTALLLTFAMPASAEEQSSKVVQQEITQLAGADYWREVREGQEGYTTSKSPEHGVLISKPGETWYILKEKWMSPAGAVAIFGSIAMVIMAYVFVGPLMLSKPRTGKKMKRWSRLDRALHWSMAFTFLTLAFSGLMLVYGKHFFKTVCSYRVLGLYRHVGEAIPQLHGATVLHFTDVCTLEMVAQVDSKHDGYSLVHENGRHGW